MRLASLIQTKRRRRTRRRFRGEKDLRDQEPLDDEPKNEGRIAHGICPRCLEYVLMHRTAVRSFLKYD
jgi:hypothetical protein